MFGIIGYIGAGEADPILPDGLERLEHRDHGSVGLDIQRFAYFAALMRGGDIDKPRNPAKSVTVE